MKTGIAVVGLLLSVLKLSAQIEYRSPVTIPIYLAGSFAELRYNHFHSGIDIKTQGREGLPIIAIADGYVSRVKVSPYGFGKAVYLNHPNGQTSVYAHLSHFAEGIDKMVKEVQYKERSYAVQLFPNRTQFRFKKGDTIAFSGNSGGSTGPHLHFEIRDTETEHPLNPLDYGFSIKDDIQPRIRSLLLYPIGENSKIKVKYFNNRIEESSFGSLSLKVEKRGNDFMLDGVEEICARGRVGVAVEVYDYHNGSGNTLGVYSAELKRDSITLHRHVYKEFSFAETRYINSHIDFDERVSRGRKYQKFFREPGNELSIYTIAAVDHSFIMSSTQAASDFEVVFQDANNNESKLNFSCKFLEENITPVSKEGELFPHGRQNKFSTDQLRLNFPDGSFYDTVYFKYEVGQNVKSSYTDLHEVHKSDIPVHRYYSLGIKAGKVPAKYHSKAVIMSVEHDGDLAYEGGEYRDGWVYCKTRVFGSFIIDVDTIAPSISAQNLRNDRNHRMGQKLKFRINDSQSGIGNYKAYLDGNWVLLEYDAKYGLLILELDGLHYSEGEHSLEIRVSDEVRNESKLVIDNLKIQ